MAKTSKPKSRKGVPQSKNFQDMLKNIFGGDAVPSPNPNDNNDDDPDNYRIEKSDCFYHKESRKLYQVTGFEKGELPNGKSILIINYIGADLHVRKLNYQNFLQRFEKTFPPVFSKSQMKKQQNKLQFALKNNKPLPLSPEAKEAKIGEDGEIIVSTSDTTEDGENLPLGTLFTPTERHSLENMIIWPDALEQINVGIESISKRKEIQEVWNLQKITDNVNQNILNFYGVSGTGKTMTAQCIARKRNQKLFQVDYSQVVDKFVGETAKHISLAFETAREKNAILFFDEADGLLSKRVDMTVNSDYANSVNQNRNVLMQELDKFDGIVIMSTNFFCNYDEAMLRRINRHIEFKLPNREMRSGLYKLHIPNLDRARVDFDNLALESKGLSGGDIKNVCINSMEIASMDNDRGKWILTDEIMLKEIHKTLDSKESHKRGVAKNKTRIGFNTEIVEDID